MKITLLIFLLMLSLIFCSPAGNSTRETEIKVLTGVAFETLSFQDTLAKTLKENKVLMVDAFTDT